MQYVVSIIIYCYNKKVVNYTYEIQQEFNINLQFYNRFQEDIFRWSYIKLIIPDDSQKAIKSIRLLNKSEIVKVLDRVFEFPDIKNREYQKLTFRILRWVLRKKRAVDYFQKYTINILVLNVFDRFQSSFGKMKQKGTQRNLIRFKIAQIQKIYDRNILFNMKVHYNFVRKKAYWKYGICTIVKVLFQQAVRFFRLSFFFRLVNIEEIYD